MSNMKTMFDLNTIDSQGGKVETTNQHAEQGAVNALEVRNLNFYYGGFQGLKNINLDIEQGKVTAFIGPSGCGKSTLLRTLNRMYDLYPGQRADGAGQQDFRLHRHLHLLVDDAEKLDFLVVLTEGRDQFQLVLLAVPNHCMGSEQSCDHQTGDQDHRDDAHGDVVLDDLDGSGLLAQISS